MYILFSSHVTNVAYQTNIYSGIRSSYRRITLFHVITSEILTKTVFRAPLILFLNNDFSFITGFDVYDFLIDAGD